MPAREAVRIEVDLDAIVSNARAVQEQIGIETGILAMLKADAYGHGLAPVASALHHGAIVTGFVVTSVVDALVLDGIRIDRPILCMPPTWEGRYAEVLQRGIIPVIGSLGDLQQFAHAARRSDITAPVHVEIDTGMARLGVREDGIDAFLIAASRSPELRITGMCTHLTSADAADATPTNRQLDAFDRVLARFRVAGHRPTMLHAANTAATWRHPRARFGHVRTGIALFGGDAPSGARLTPALRLISRIVQLRVVKRGEAVSYGETWVATRPSVVATVPVGYAHGYPRRLAGKAEVLVSGQRCPVLGTICMEMMLVDVTDLMMPTIGDEVILFGDQGDEAILAIDAAQGIDGIVEEIYCGLSKTVPRDYVRSGERTLSITMPDEEEGPASFTF